VNRLLSVFRLPALAGTNACVAVCDTGFRWQSGNTFASDTSDPGSTPSHGTLVDDSSFHSIRVGKLSISFGWGLKSCRALVELANIICRAAVYAVSYRPTLVLPASCQQCKACSVQIDISVRIAIEKC
jgi:hypothetical protein